MKLKTFLYIFGIVAVTLTIFPFIAVDYWWIRIFDFPHVQLTILTFVALLTFFMRFDVKRLNDYIFAGIVGACFVVQLVKIYPYTPLAPVEVGNSEKAVESRTISLFAANVLQKNKKPEKLLKDFLNKNPDLLLLVETDKNWMEFITAHLPSEYAYKTEVPLSNTYGMLLYSKFELIDPEIKFLVDKEIPSIHSKLRLPSGDTIQLYTIHPTPPMPQHNPLSTDRDSEMMKIAFLSKQSKYPVIVMGDFNDVAWSNTTSLFQNVGELLDMRKGRGFYNTFNAKSFLMRWPLDHIFVSAEFRVISLKVGEDIDSDHFPTFAEISFEPKDAAKQEPKKANENQLKRAREQAERVSL